MLDWRDRIYSEMQKRTIVGFMVMLVAGLIWLHEHEEERILGMKSMMIASIVSSAIGGFIIMLATEIHEKN